MRFNRIVVTAAAVTAVTFPAVLSAPAAAAAPAVVTITYDLSAAPDYASVIREGISHWNSALHNVQFSEASGGAMLTYHEGDFQEGSYYQGDSHGRGDVYIDNTQAQQYDQVRIAAHETGHDLGLPDDYQGPCSELMSGGGPGPSCTNSNPDSDEIARADANFADGLRAEAHRRSVTIVG